MDTRILTQQPKTHVAFTTTKKVAGVIHAAGAVVPRDTLPRGCVEAMFRLGELTECDTPAPPAPAVKQFEPTPNPVPFEEFKERVKTEAKKPKQTPAAKPEPLKENK